MTFSLSQVQRRGKLVGRKGHRRGAAGAFGVDHRGDVVDPLLHERATTDRGRPCWCARRSAASDTALMRAEGLEEHVDTGAPEAFSGRRVDWRPVPPSRSRPATITRSKQREQHRVLGREVEVERRPGEAGAFGQVVDRDIGERTFGQQPLGGAPGWPASRSSPDGRVERRPRGARAGAGGSHEHDFTRC